MILKITDVWDVAGVSDSVVEYAANAINHRPIYFSEPERALLKAGFDFTPFRIDPLRVFKLITKE